MRIIAGTLKGRRLAAPTWEGLRPTSDKLRETLFNVIADRTENARFLDGFAGTGAVGLEALSRGAAHVTFIEKDPRACRLIEENAERCGVTDGYIIVRGGFAGGGVVNDGGARQKRGDSARRPRPRPGPLGPLAALGPFDVIFLDPPYADPVIADAMRAAVTWLTPSGLLIVEHAARDPTAEPSGMRLTRDLKSGDSALAFMERVGEHA
jgi:16S rRNA (guanine966-N2)-methyltransferase